MKSVKEALEGIEDERDIQDILLMRGLIRVLKRYQSAMTAVIVAEYFNFRSDHYGVSITRKKTFNLLKRAEQYSEVHIFGYDDDGDAMFVDNDTPVCKFSVVEAPDNGDTKPPAYFINLDEAKKYALDTIGRYSIGNNATVTVYENKYSGGKISHSATLHEYSYSCTLVDKSGNEVIEYC